MVWESVLAGELKHDAEPLTCSPSMRRPESAGELMQFLQAVNWLRTSTPRMAEVVGAICGFLKEHMASTKRRTKLVASNRAVSAEELTAELIGMPRKVSSLTLWHCLTRNRGGRCLCLRCLRFISRRCLRGG